MRGGRGAEGLLSFCEIHQHAAIGTGQDNECAFVCMYVCVCVRERVYIYVHTYINFECGV